MNLVKYKAYLYNCKLKTNTQVSYTRDILQWSLSSKFNINYDTNPIFNNKENWEECIARIIGVDINDVELIGDIEDVELDKLHGMERVCFSLSSDDFHNLPSSLNLVLVVKTGTTTIPSPFSDKLSERVSIPIALILFPDEHFITGKSLSIDIDTILH